jgi:hypothetical protein
MADISKSVFDTIYAGVLGVFQDNSNREISEEDMRNCMTDISDSLFPLWIETAITAANFRAIGSVPVSLVSAPGVGYFLSPYRAILTKNVGTGVAFDFSEGIIIKAGGDAIYYIDPGVLNIAGAICLDLVKQGQEIVTNTALTITTVDGSDATVGGSGVKVKVYYKIENTYV